jgi:heme A synthase
MTARYSISAIGAAGTATVMFWLGRELRQWIPDKSGRAFGVVAVAIVPVVIGTAVVILINQPVPPALNFTAARVSEQAFAIFTVIGAATGPRPSTGSRSFRLRWIDGTIAIGATLVVRIMVFGISLRG